MAEYIDRNVVVNALIDVENRYNLDRDRTVIPAEMLYMDLCRTEISLGKLPAADVAPVVHGRWVIVDDGVMIGDGKHMECSVCHTWNKDRINTDYCPNCGAKMDLEG